MELACDLQIVANERGKVELCHDLRTGERHIRKVMTWENREFAAREIAVSSKLARSQMVVEMLDYYISNNNCISLIYRYAPNGDLLDYLDDNPELRRNSAWLRRIFTEIVSGVKHMHDMNIIHRDLKLENIVITAKGVAQLCDFSFAEWIENPVGFVRMPHSPGITKFASHSGLSLIVDIDRALCKNTVYVAGTAGCVSPETMQTRKATAATDVYALGVLLYEMVTGCMVTGCKAFVEAAVDDDYCKISYPGWLVQMDGGGLIRLIKGMLASDPDERMTIEDVLVDEWLTPKQEKCVS